MQSLGEQILMVVLAPAWLSLAWLIIGLLLGMRVPQQPQRFRHNGVSGAARNRGGPLELYVGNLPPDTTEDVLRQSFERFGHVNSVRVLTSRAEGGAKVFAFIMMASPHAADAAIHSMNGKDFDGRRMVVNEARSPRRRGRR